MKKATPPVAFFMDGAPEGPGSNLRSTKYASILGGGAFCRRGKAPNIAHKAM